MFTLSIRSAYLNRKQEPGHSRCWDSIQDIAWIYTNTNLAGSPGDYQYNITAWHCIVNVYQCGLFSEARVIFHNNKSNRAISLSLIFEVPLIILKKYKQDWELYFRKLHTRKKYSLNSMLTHHQWKEH